MLHIIEIAIKKIKHGNIGAGTTFFFAMMLSLTVFAGQILAYSLSGGAEKLRERLGADIAVVPRGQEGNYQGILLSGEPVACAMERSLEDQIRSIDGVAKVTPVVYLASLNASCCSVPIQIIGYEPETDFVTNVWISERYTSDRTEGSLVVGCNIAAEEQNQLTFFGRTYRIQARLQKTGTGMDKSVYVTFDVMEQMIRDARTKGVVFGSEMDHLENTEHVTDEIVSAFLIRVAEGVDPDKVAGYLIRHTSAGVVQSKNLFATVTNGMKVIFGVISALKYGMLIIVTAVTAVLHVFRVQVRKKEWAVFHMMGASKGWIMTLILCETFLLSLGGAMTGIGLASLLIFPFQELIAQRIQLPYLTPGLWRGMLAGLISMGITLLSGILPGVAAGVLAIRTDCYELMREGEI